MGVPVVSDELLNSKIVSMIHESDTENRLLEIFERMIKNNEVVAEYISMSVSQCPSPDREYVMRALMGLMDLLYSQAEVDELEAN